MKKLLHLLVILALLGGAGAWVYQQYVYDQPAPLGCGLPLEASCLAEGANQDNQPDLLASLPGVTRLLPRIAPSDSNAAAIAEAMAFAGAADRALTVAGGIEDPAARAAAYRRIALAAARAKDQPRAKLAADAALAAAASLPAGSSAALEAGSDAAAAEIAAGAGDAARRQLASLVQSAGSLGDAPGAEPALPALAGALAAAGEGEAALAAAGRIAGSTARDEALISVVGGLAASGDPLIDKAISGIATGAARVRALAREAEIAGATGRGEAAQVALIAAIALAGALPAEPAAERSAAYGALARAEAHLGRFAAAENSVGRCAIDADKLAALAEIAAARSAAGDGDALKTLDEMQPIVARLKGSPDYDAALGWLAAAQASLGDGEAALASLDQIVSKRMRSAALVRVALALAGVGQPG